MKIRFFQKMKHISKWFILDLKKKAAYNMRVHMRVHKICVQISANKYNKECKQTCKDNRKQT